MGLKSRFCSWRFVVLVISSAGDLVVILLVKFRCFLQVCSCELAKKLLRCDLCAGEFGVCCGGEYRWFCLSGVFVAVAVFLRRWYFGMLVILMCCCFVVVVVACRLSNVFSLWLCCGFVPVVVLMILCWTLDLVCLVRQVSFMCWWHCFNVSAVGCLLCWSSWSDVCCFFLPAKPSSQAPYPSMGRKTCAYKNIRMTSDSWYDRVWPPNTPKKHNHFRKLILWKHSCGDCWQHPFTIQLILWCQLSFFHALNNALSRDITTNPDC